VLSEAKPRETTKMAARTQSKVTPKYKTKYRVRNWAAYEESLRRRGDITVWFDADAMQQRHAPTPCNNASPRRPVAVLGVSPVTAANSAPSLFLAHMKHRDRRKAGA
jgi:hypothetical protein